MEDSRAERWDRQAQVPMMVVSLVFVAAYAWPILDPGLDPDLVRACSAVVWLTWALLAARAGVRFVAGGAQVGLRRRSTRSTSPRSCCPILRPLRLLRLLTLLDVLNRYAGSSLRGRVGCLPRAARWP